MTTASPQITADGRYASLHALREAHLQLLAQERARSDGPAFATAVRRFLERGAATGALLHDLADRRAAQSLLDYWATSLYVPGDLPTITALAPFDINSAPALPDSLAPYVGLDAFDDHTRDRFFGRSELIESMLQQLHRRRMLAVVGTSGSGKSSLVRAGVLPATAGPGPNNPFGWRVLPPLMPGSNPVESLVTTVYQAAGRGTTPAGAPLSAWERRVAASLTRSVFTQKLTLSALLDTWGGPPVVVTVDQFEELFTLCRDTDARTLFAEQLVGLITNARATHGLIITMRGDFEDNVARLTSLKPLFDQARVQVTAMNITQLREAIEEPARRVGLVFDDGIVDDLISDALGETAALPLLQFTLSKLWESRERNRVTRAAYERLGGMGEALSRSADSWYQKLIPQHKQTAQRILLELVRPSDPVLVAAEAVYKGERRSIERLLSEGKEVLRTRRRKQELFRSGEDPDNISQVLDGMIAQRLVRLSPGDTPADDQIEVAHEALIRNWKTLQGWINADYERLRQRGRLIEAASLWEESGRNPDRLWRGSELEDARRLGFRDGSVGPFLDAGRAEEERLLEERRMAAARAAEARAAEAEARAAEAEARTARVEAERVLDREQARSARRLRYLSVVLALLTAIAVIASLFAINQAVSESAARAVAEEQRGIAIAEAAEAATQRTLAQTSEVNAANAALTAEAGRLIAVSAEALAQAEAANALNSRGTAEAERGLAERAATQNAAAIATQNVLVATQNVLNEQLAQQRGTAVAAEATNAALSATQVAQLDAERQRLEAENQRQLDENARLEVSAYTNGVFALAASASADELRARLNEGIALAGRIGAAAVADPLQGIIQRLEDLGPPEQRISPSGTITSATWSNDSTKVLISSGTAATIWDASTRAMLAPPLSHPQTVNSAAWSSDGTRIVTAGADGLVRIWSASDGQLLVQLRGHNRAVRGVAWSPDDQRIASADGNELVVWSADGRILGRQPAPSEQLTRAAWSPDGGNIVTAGPQLRLRSGVTAELLLSATAESSLVSAAWSPDGQRLLTVSTTGQTQLWAAGGLGLQLTLGDNACEARAAMWSRTGLYLVVGCGDGTVRTFEAGAGTLNNMLYGHTAPVRAVTWSPDGMRIVSAGNDGRARIFFFYADDVLKRARELQ